MQNNMKRSLMQEDHTLLERAILTRSCSMTSMTGFSTMDAPDMGYKIGGDAVGRKETGMAGFARPLSGKNTGEKELGMESISRDSSLSSERRELEVML